MASQLKFPCRLLFYYSLALFSFTNALFSQSANLPAQAEGPAATWINCQTPQRVSWVSSAIPDPEGGIIFGGATSGGAPFTYLMRVDEKGDSLWYKDLPVGDYFNDLVKGDGVFLMSTHTSPTTALSMLPDEEAKIQAFNFEGKEQWKTLLDKEKCHRINHLCRTANGNFGLFGMISTQVSSWGMDYAHYDMEAVQGEIGANGKVKWLRNHGGKNNMEITLFAGQQSGGTIVGGTDYDREDEQFRWVNTDEKGRVKSVSNYIWEIDEYDYYSFHSATQLDNGNLFLAGTVQKIGALALLKPNGEPIWETSIEDLGYYQKTFAQNDELLVIGVRNEEQLVVISFDQKGEKLWEKASPKHKDLRVFEVFEDAKGRLNILAHHDKGEYDYQVFIWRLD